MRIKILYSCLLGMLMTVLTAASSYSQSLTMNSPASATYLNTVPVQWTITPTTQYVTKIVMIFTYVSGREALPGTTDTLTFSAYKTKLKSGSFILNPLTVNTDTSFASVSLNSPLPDGTWSVKMQYTRTDTVNNTNLTISSATATITTSTHTLAAKILSPLSNTTVGAIFMLKDSCYSTPALSGSPKQYMFARGTDTTKIFIRNSTVYDSIRLNINNLLGSYAAFDSVAPIGAVLTEGVYDIVFSYKDNMGHAPYVTKNQNVTIDLHTATPSISNADTGNTIGHRMNLTYNLPETALAGSVRLLLNDGTTTTSLPLSTTAAGSHNISIDLNNIAATASLTSSPVSSLPSGTYTVSISYQDVIGNPAASYTGPTLTAVTVTPPPTINAPVSSTVSARTLHVDFTLPPAVLGGSVKLILASPHRSDTLILSTTTSAAFDINANNISTNSTIASSTATSLPDGTYTITLSYLDPYNNPAATASVTGVVIDGTTQAPVLTSPGTSSTGADNITVSYTLPETALAGSVKLEFIGSTSIGIVLNQETAGPHTITINGNNIASSTGVTSSTAPKLSMGSYGAVALSYQDAVGNTRAYTLNNSFTYSSTLPLVLNGIKGTLQGSKTLLLWDTFSENNTAFFDVEYSTNAASFKKVGQVAAAGNSSTEKDYKFVHTSPGVGDNFYRLRMVDQDGSYKYSEVIAVYMDKGKIQFKVYPNPARDQINVVIVSSEGNKSRVLNVWDNNGRIVKRITVNPIAGSNLFTVPMSDLVPGMYLVQDGDNIASFVKL